MNNLSSYFGLVDAKIRPSDKDLPVHMKLWRFQKGFDYIMHSAVVAARGLRNLDDRFDE